MRLVLAAVLLCALPAGGCGGSPGPLEMVEAEPPSGARDLGVTGTKRSTSDPGSRIPRFRVEAGDGSALAYAVTVRNTGSEPVEVTGVAGDRDRDGAFLPERVADAPVRVAAGDEQEVTVEGRVDGCRFGGQIVSLAGPEMELRTDGDERTQELGMPIEVELKATGCRA